MKHAHRNRALGGSIRSAFFRMGWVAGLGLSAALVLGCNEHPVGPGEGPEFRGITVPLPPPSFRSATFVDVQFSGQAAGFEGGRAIAWDLETSQGLATAVGEDGAFTFAPLKLNLGRHCVEARASRDFQAPSDPRFYALKLGSAEQCGQGACSASDSQGECVCVVRYAGNCVNREPWPSLDGAVTTEVGGSTGASGSLP